MNAISYTTAQQDLVATMERVCAEQEAIIITHDQQSVVMMSLEAYKSLEETIFLLKNPTNADRLLQSIAELEAGQGMERELLD
jgi:antitoxin YefM